MAQTTDIGSFQWIREVTGVFAGDPSPLVDALPSDEVIRLASRCARTSSSGSRLVQTLAPLCRRISITGSKGNEIPQILYLLREDPSAFYLFTCNTGYRPDKAKADPHDRTMCRDRRAVFSSVSIKGFHGALGHPLELDPSNGDIHLAEAW